MSIFFAFYAMAHFGYVCVISVTCPAVGAAGSVEGIVIYFEEYMYQVKYDVEEKNLKFTQDELKIQELPSAILENPESTDEERCFFLGKFYH